MALPALTSQSAAPRIRRSHEADVPAQQSAAQAHPRIPRAHADPLGPRCDLGAAAQGTQEAFGVNSGPDRRRETFSRDDRLRKRREFEACYASGVRVSGRHLQVFFLRGSAPATPSASPPRPRLGLSVSRRVGGAVDRNRIRRRLREIFRRNRDLFGDRGGDLVINARPPAAQASFTELRDEYRSLVGRGLSRSPADPASR
jgi:ribonuclease P protein component